MVKIVITMPITAIQFISYCHFEKSEYILLLLCKRKSDRVISCRGIARGTHKRQRLRQCEDVSASQHHDRREFRSE